MRCNRDGKKPLLLMVIAWVREMGGEFVERIPTKTGHGTLSMTNK
jgi:hypothetical protein